MSIGLRVKLSGFEVVSRRLSRLADPDFDALLDVIGALLETQTRRRIKSEKKSPTGQAWDQLTDRYAAWKSAHSSGGLLELHGSLVDSITFEKNVAKKELYWGSNVAYARKHQLGGGKKDPATPARPYLGVSVENQGEIDRVVEDWLREIVG